MSDQTAIQTTTKSVQMGFDTVQGFEMMQRAAKLLSSSTLVPKEYQGNLPNCVIALNMANRMMADPLMIMQNLVVIHGRPTWSSQFAIATINTCGRFTALRYEWVGEEGKDSWGCRAWAVEKTTGEKLTGSTITIDLAKKEGWYSRKDRNGNETSKWQTMPQQMLMYRAASWFVRAYAPELMMGLHTAEEIGDIVDVTPDEYEVQEEIRAKANAEVIDITPPEKAEEPEAESDPEPKGKPAKKEQAPKQQPAQGTLEGGPGF
ncbi:MAG: hypothetical protein ACOX8T_11810 [Bacillota bacterium]|jgi:hypothetical protein